MNKLWNLPTEPGTVIAIGEWWLVRLRSYEGAPSAWELLPSKELTGLASRNGVTTQTVYDDAWVYAEADQEGGYYIISKPVDRPYGPHTRTREVLDPNEAFTSLDQDEPEIITVVKSGMKGGEPSEKTLLERATKAEIKHAIQNGIFDIQNRIDLGQATGQAEHLASQVMRALKGEDV